MSRTTVTWDGVLEPGDEPVGRPLESGWQAFLQSWKWAAILVTACALGVVAILVTHPFASKSVSDRVSDAIGRTVSCTTAGVAAVAGNEVTVYRCGALPGSSRPGQCFTVSGRDVRQLGGNRKLGC